VLQQKDSIDSGETLRNKKPFFTCCHLLHYYILLRCHSHKFPVTTILGLLKPPFNEGFSYFKIISYVAVVIERRTSVVSAASIIPGFMPVHKVPCTLSSTVKMFFFLSLLKQFMYLS